MIIHCMPGKVAIVLDPPEGKTFGGLHLPDTVKGDNHIGTVIAVGSDIDAKMFMADDRVIIPRYAAAPVMLEGREIHFMKATDVLARLTEEVVHAGLD